MKTNSRMCNDRMDKGLKKVIKELISLADLAYEEFNELEKRSN